MKKNLLLFGGAAVLALATAACSSDNDTPNPDPKPNDEAFTGFNLSANEKQIVSEVNKFTMKYFAEEMKTADLKKENLFVSPYNSYVHLSLLANGNASGELARTLYPEGEGNEDLNKFNNTILQGLPKVDKTVDCKFSSALWYNNALLINEQFAKDLLDYYAAELNKTEMGSQATVDAINSWANRVTNGLIPAILSERLPDSEEIYLANAGYFKGEWTLKFDPKDTKTGDFTNIDGSKGTASFMYLDDHIFFNRVNGADIVELPYGDGDFKMRIYLPEEGTDIKTFVSSMTAAQYESTGCRLYPVTLYMPKFDITSFTSSETTLKSIGVINPALQFGNIFQSTLLNWPNITQVARIIVNEEGTEAGAVNAPITDPGDDLPKHVTVRLDRPFVYFIKESTTGTILFSGAVTHF